MSRLLILSIALIAAVAATTFTDVPFKNCNSQFSVKSLEASECSLVDVDVKGEQRKMCLFKPDSKPVIRITFTPNESGIDALETSVRAKFGKATLPYSMADYATCLHGHITCPLEAGKEQTYSQEFHVDPSYPKSELFQVNWNIGKGNTKHVCIVFFAKIE